MNFERCIKTQCKSCRFYNSCFKKRNENKKKKKKVLQLGNRNSKRQYKNICQFFLGKWNDGKHFPNKIKITKAEIVHHIIPIKQRPDLALDINNMISLSFEAHEIIEDRNRFRYRKRKRITQERW